MTTNIAGDRHYVHLRYPATSNPPSTGNIYCGAEHRSSPYPCCRTTINDDAASAHGSRPYPVTCPDCLIKYAAQRLRAAADDVEPKATLQRVLARCHEDDPARAIYRSVAS